MRDILSVPWIIDARPLRFRSRRGEPGERGRRRPIGIARNVPGHGIGRCGRIAHALRQHEIHAQPVHGFAKPGRKAEAGAGGLEADEAAPNSIMAYPVWRCDGIRAIVVACDRF